MSRFRAYLSKDINYDYSMPVPSDCTVCYHKSSLFLRAVLPAPSDCLAGYAWTALPITPPGPPDPLDSPGPPEMEMTETGRNARHVCGWQCREAL